MDFFAYGTLQFDAVVNRVCGRTFPGRAASLPEYACYCVRGRSYPGVVRQAGGVVYGRVYAGVSVRDFQRLDRYEGTEYLRRLLDIVLDDDEIGQAWVYLPRNPALLSNRIWRREVFSSRDLRRWLRNERNGL